MHNLIFSGQSFNTYSLTAGVVSFMVGICLIIVIITLASLWKVFTKAGKPGWAAIIPFYNLVVVLDIINKPRWWVLLFIFFSFIGQVGTALSVILGIYVLFKLAEAFGRGTLFTIGLYVLPFIFFPILAWGKAEYKDPKKVTVQTPQVPTQ